jgi:peptidoglycan/LPS O-acetylase OafA/YrhL
MAGAITCLLVAGSRELQMTQSSSNTRQTRIPALDGLRGFAILMVVSIHYFYDPGAKLPRLLNKQSSLVLKPGELYREKSLARMP